MKKKNFLIEVKIPLLFKFWGLKNLLFGKFKKIFGDINA